MSNYIGFSEDSPVVLGTAERKTIQTIEESEDITIFIEEKKSKQCFGTTSIESPSFLSITLENGHFIECGPNQLFYVKDSDFVEAQSLSIGDVLVELDDDDVVITDIETTAESKTLYSITFDSSDSINETPYFIGSEKCIRVK